MFDTQRNLLTTLLAAGLGLIVLAGLAMALLLGRPDVDSIEPTGNARPDSIQVDAPDTGLEAFERYAAILERPVFFSDRTLPVVEEPAEVEEEPETEEEEEVSDLEAAVAGIVITPEVKLAMVADEQAGKTVVLREGMSLEGEQAAWKLESIEPRRVAFVSVDGRESMLELKVNTSGLKGGSSGVRQREEPGGTEDDAEQAGQEEQSAAQVSEEARARAEEIRRRVAERRAQLRAEAERRAQQNEQQRDNDG